MKRGQFHPWIPPNKGTIHEIDGISDEQLFAIKTFYDGESLGERMDRMDMVTGR